MSDADIIANEQFFQDNQPLVAGAAAYPVTLNVSDLA
jgi:hypothetical protein